MALFQGGLLIFYFYEAGAIAWDPDTLSESPPYLRGARVLVYKEESGNFVPLKPTALSADSTQLYFADIQLPDPDLSDRSNNVGAYAVLSNRIVSFRATCYDPSSGRLIESNTVRLSLELPASLVGDHVFESSPSYGFRVVSTSTDASAIGGANYFTINPLAQNINRLGVTSYIP